jgi:putative ABC transport system permease protein
MLTAIGKDVRYALRTLAKAPGFAAIVVLTMALGIGANSAIFSVIQGVLLRPLPYPQADRLVRIYFNSDTQPKFPLNPYDFRDFRSRNRTFESMAALNRHDMALSGAGESIRLRAFVVTADYFRVLGLSPARGREFHRDDELAGHGQSAILSDRVWRTQFSADPNIVGRTLTLDARVYTVVGVMPPGTQHPGNNFNAVADGDTVDVWCPFLFDEDPNQRGSHYMDVIGRLKPGISPEQAHADLSAVLNQIKNEHQGFNGWRVYTVPLRQELVGRQQKTLYVLLGAVGLLLLIACVNAANLLLARASARECEIAVRSALGAARGRIVRQLLTESLLIAVAGAALGTVLAVAGVKVMVAYLPQNFPRASEIRLDAGVFTFTLVTAVLTGLLFGLVPALTASRVNLVQSLREGARGSTGSGRQLHLRNVLATGEIALACVLLIVAGLMLHGFINLLKTDPGFRPQQVLTASISVPYEHYKNASQRIGFYNNLIAELEKTPGVEAAGVATDLPWTGYDGNADGFSVEGRTAEFNRKTTARYHESSPDYFRAMGIPLRSGRYFTLHDDEKAQVAIIVNETMAKRYWPGENALGKRITFRSKPEEKDWFNVVGVVGDVKDQADSGPPRPALWFPYAQMAERGVSLAVRTNGDPGQITGRLREIVRGLDPGLAIADLRLMKQIADASVSGERFALSLVGLFAVIALVLAAIGIYGVISYSVNRRMHEFGMRMALGAGQSDLMSLIFLEGLKLTVVGTALGLASAAAFGKVIESVTFEVTGRDPVTFVAVAVVAFTMAAVACYIPARRASRADPMRLLRAE